MLVAHPRHLTTAEFPKKVLLFLRSATTQLFCSDATSQSVALSKPCNSYDLTPCEKSHARAVSVAVLLCRRAPYLLKLVYAQIRDPDPSEHACIKRVMRACPLCLWSCSHDPVMTGHTVACAECCLRARKDEHAPIATGSSELPSPLNQKASNQGSGLR